MGYSSIQDPSLELYQLRNELASELPNVRALFSSEEHMLFLVNHSLFYYNQNTRQFTLLDIDFSEYDSDIRACWLGGKECLTAVLCNTSLHIWYSDTGKLLAKIERLVNTILLLGCSCDCRRFFLYFPPTGFLYLEPTEPYEMKEEGYDSRLGPILRNLHTLLYEDQERERESASGHNSDKSGNYAVVYLDPEASLPASKYYPLYLPVSDQGVASEARNGKITIFDCYSGRPIDDLFPLAGIVNGCDFTGAEMDDELKRVLRQNGAIVDPE